MDIIEERKKWDSFSPQTEDTIDNVLFPDQKFMVFQLAQAETSIRSHDAKPWIRCIGFTVNIENARVLAKSAFDERKIETRIMPTGRVFLAGRYKYNDIDMERRKEEQEKAHALVDSHIEKRALVLQRKEITETVSNPLPAPPSTAPTLSLYDKSCVFIQKYFAIAIVQDPSELNEPAIIPLFAMDSMDELNAKVKNAGKSKDLIHFDIFCAPTNEWLPLSNPTSYQTFHKHPLRQELESHIKWDVSDKESN